MLFQLNDSYAIQLDGSRSPTMLAILLVLHQPSRTAGSPQHACAAMVTALGLLGILYSSLTLNIAYISNTYVYMLDPAL